MPERMGGGVEAPRSPERLSGYRELTGLQGRMVLREVSFLNPASTVPSVEGGHIAPMTNRRYDIFQNVSVHDRKAYWENKGVAGFDNQMTQWSRSMVGLFGKEEYKPHVQKLTGILQKSGANAAAFGEQDAQRLYQKYFSGNEGVKTFVNDVLNSYMTNGYLDRARMQGDMKEIQWMANIFGDKSSEIISQLADAEVQIQTEQPTFIAKLNAQTSNTSRINRPNLETREEELLAHIWRYGQVDATPPTPTPTPPVTPPTTPGTPPDVNPPGPRPPDTDPTIPDSPAPPVGPRRILENAEIIDMEFLGEDPPTGPEKKENFVFPVRREQNMILEKLKKTDQLIFTGGTGTGKTTVFPVIMLETLLKDNQNSRMAVTQPLKIITQQTAGTIQSAYLEANPDGEKNVVGFRHGEENTVTKDTKVDVIVEQSFLRLLLEDEKLEKYDYVMVDEVHQRNTNTDIILGLLVKVQARRKAEGLPVLKIIASSATLDEEALGRVMPDALPPKGEIADVKGVTRPRHDQWLAENETEVPMIKEGRFNTEGIDAITQQVEQVIFHSQYTVDGNAKRKDDGMIVFMPGKPQITAVKQQIEDMCKRKGLIIDEKNPKQDTVIVELHGEVTPTQRTLALDEHKGKRVIIIATNSIETGLTPKSRIVHVIDSGVERINYYNPNLEMEVSELRYCLQSSAKQRAGRVGRRIEGYYWPMFKKSSNDAREEFKKPEIINADLSSTLLLMKKLDVDPQDFAWPTKPPDEAFVKGEKTLQALGAVDASGNLTTIGKDMADFPVDIRAARIVVEGIRIGKPKEAAIVAAVMEAKSIFAFNSGQKEEAIEALDSLIDHTSDINTVLNIYQAYERVPEPEKRTWVKDRHLNFNGLTEVRKTIGRIMKALPTAATRPTGVTGTITDCLLAAYGDKTYIKTQQLRFGKAPNPVEVVNVYKSESNPAINGYSMRMSIGRDSFVSRSDHARVMMLGVNPNMQERKTTGRWPGYKFFESNLVHPL